jgi:hypothetical protein
MSRSLRHQSLFLAGALSFAACTFAASPALFAAEQTTSDIIQPGAPREDGGKKLRQLPPDLLQNPGARVMRLQQLRQSIVQRVKRLDDSRYRDVVRPSLERQLQQLGFDDRDVTYFLTDLDRSRGAR